MDTGFQPAPEFQNVSLPPGTAGLHFVLNGDYLADLRDLIIVLQTIAGMSPALVYVPKDIDGDEKINLAEAAYLMRNLMSAPNAISGSTTKQEVIWSTPMAP